MRRILSLLLAFAVALLVIPFGVANRHLVPMTIDPFRQLNSSLTFELPLSLLLFLAFVAGLVLGGVATWFTQGKWRRTAKDRSREAYRWRSEADRLARERDAREGATAGALPSPSSGL